jgi:hypothetical protein
MMRRLGIVRLDAFQFNRFHRGRLALNFLLQSFEQFILPGHHVVQLLDLMFEMRDVRFKFFHPPGHFICHAKDFARDFQQSRADDGNWLWYGLAGAAVWDGRKAVLKQPQSRRSANNERLRIARSVWTACGSPPSRACGMRQRLPFKLDHHHGN